MANLVIHRKFVYSDIKKNSNKYWECKWWDDGTYEATYGRVGDMSTDTKHGVSREYVESKIREKTRPGRSSGTYREIDLHVPDTVAHATPTHLDPKIAAVMDWIASEAGDDIRSHTAVPVDELSKAQLRQGKAILDAIRAKGSADLIQDYLNTVPTVVPFRRMNEFDVVTWFMRTLAERYDQLEQLEANLSVAQAKAGGDTSLFAGLDIQMQPFDPADPDYPAVRDYCLSTAKPGSDIIHLLRLEIGPERQAWEAETKGKHNVVSLFHGTRSPNVQKILRSGLIIPQMAANGSRFGRGIYMADHARRSQNYAHSLRNGWKPVFIVDAALGTQYQMSGDDHTLTDAPQGYDSVWGVNSYGGLDEFIVYRTSQQTIRALCIYG